MKELKLMITAALLCCITSSTQASQQIDKKGGLIINGEILDPQLLTDRSYESEIEIIISEFPFDAISMNYSPNKKIRLKYKAGETFKVTIPGVSNMNYMAIGYSTPQFNNDRSWIDNIYMISAGDSIHCQLKPDSRTFTGKGAAKLQCHSDVYALKYRPTRELIKQLRNPETFLKGLDVLNQKSDSVFKQQLKIIERYKDRLPDTVLKRMTANCIGISYLGFMRSMYAKMGSDIYLRLMNSDFYKKIQSPLENLHNDDLERAPIYTSFLLYKIKMDASLIVKDYSEATWNVHHINKCYELIKHNYTGKLRDKLIALLIVNGKTEGQQLLVNALQEIRSNTYRNLLKTILSIKAKGTKFSQFELKDANDNIVKLSEFKDKVVLLDFWYTGCMPCMNLNRALKPVYDKFKNDPNVKFISISIDEFKNWKISLEEGKYTNPNGIHLYTGGLDTEHPIIKENNIVSYPQLYLLKNGNLYNAALPLPKGPDDLFNISALNEIINEAIKAK
jgi:thiol-disulfide isomerase/thioredoxin